MQHRGTNAAVYAGWRGETVCGNGARPSLEGHRSRAHDAAGEGQDSLALWLEEKHETDRTHHTAQWSDSLCPRSTHLPYVCLQARNQEKAQSMLYRFREAQNAELGIGIKNERRPTNSASVTSVREADKWRGNIIREISRKVSKIQDSGLTEYQVRDLNDRINKLFREKRHWEYRIKELGGPDYRRGSSRVLDAEGKEVPGSRGYRYFGRAKELPGVKELFEHQQTLEDAPKTRAEMHKAVGADYYGYRDEEDGKLVAYETALRQAMYGQEIAYDKSEGLGDPPAADDGVDPSASFEETRNVYKYVDECVPTLSEVEAWLVRKRKQELMDQFLG
ncbi:NineTeen Complex (NTC) component [Entophlyctis luteolus]|nr:NineTeen Complex (NTC) component [Entophlyctis luteolus]